MAADRFTLYAHRLLANTKIAEVEFTGLEYTETLSKQGALTFDLPAFSGQATDGTLEPTATSLHVDDNDLLRFGAMLWEHDLDASDAQNMRVASEGHFSYYQNGPTGPRRTIDSRQGMTYAISTGATNGTGVEITFPNASQGTPVDMFDVVADLLAHAASIAGSALPSMIGGANVGFHGIRFHGPGAATTHPEASGNLSGVTWARTYWSSDLKGIGEAITEIASSYPGFDWGVNYEWDQTTSPPTPKRYLDLYYPRRGQARSGVTLEHGGNVSLLTGNRSGAGSANQLRGIGAGTGASVLQSLQQDPSVLAAGYPFLQGKYDASDEAMQENLDARTRAWLAVTRLPVNVFSVDVVSDANYGIRLGDVGIGDTCRFIAKIAGSGYTIDDLYRVTQQHVVVGSTGLEKWELTLVQDIISTGVF